MLVKDVMSKDLAFCTPEETVVDAAKLMKATNLDTIPVVQDKSSRKLLGIVTERDIAIKVVAEGRNPRESKLGSIMARDILSTSPDEDLGRPAQIMQEREVRRIPVVDEKGSIVGIVAQIDIARENGDA
jgi:CBS domain-containing protein